MNERDGLFLNHVLGAISEIESFTTDGRSGFMADRKTPSTVIRQLEMVYGPGGYRFADFLRFGIPLNLVVAVTTIVMTPLVFPFHA